MATKDRGEFGNLRIAVGRARWVGWAIEDHPFRSRRDGGGQLFGRAVGVPRGVGCELGAIDRHQSRAQHARPRAQGEHLREEPGEGPFMRCAEPSDRRMVRSLVDSDHPEGDVFDAATLDTPAGALADRVRVDEQRHHHRRVIGSATAAIGPIASEEHRKVELGDDIEHEPDQMILRQPVRQRGRHQN